MLAAAPTLSPLLSGCSANYSCLPERPAIGTSHLPAKRSVPGAESGLGAERKKAPVLLLRLQENDLPLRSGRLRRACRADHLSAAGSISETTKPSSLLCQSSLFQMYTLAAQSLQSSDRFTYSSSQLTTQTSEALSARVQHTAAPTDVDRTTFILHTFTCADTQLT